MSILETVQRHRTEQQRARRETAIGADLIPRAARDDSRYAGVDLPGRSRAMETLRVGMSRLSLAPDDLPVTIRATAERIAEELRAAGPEETGRWATDVLYAYADVPHISPVTETAMFLTWALSLDGDVGNLVPP